MEEEVKCPNCGDYMNINHTFRSIPVYVCRRWGWPDKYPKDCNEVIAVKDYVAPTS